MTPHKLSALVAVVISLAFSLALFSPLPASAHSDTELSSYLSTWEARFFAQFPDPDPNRLSLLWAELSDMRERHPCRRAIGSWDSSCEGAATARPTSSSSSSPYRGMGTDVEQWRGLVAAYFPASEVERALCIMAKESGGNPNAKNPRSSASGLFQHLARHWGERSSAAGWGGASIWNPEANIAVAAWLQRTGGWTHWSPYNRGYCR